MWPRAKAAPRLFSLYCCKSRCVYWALHVSDYVHEHAKNAPDAGCVHASYWHTSRSNMFFFDSLSFDSTVNSTSRITEFSKNIETRSRSTENVTIV